MELLILPTNPTINWMKYQKHVWVNMAGSQKPPFNMKVEHWNRLTGWLMTGTVVAATSWYLYARGKYNRYQRVPLPPDMRGRYQGEEDQAYRLILDLMGIDDPEDYGVQAYG